MTRLVLHIGSHKTGTTSIQHFLEAAHDEIEALTGLQYVPVRRRDLPAINPRLDDPETFRRFGATANSDYLDYLKHLGSDLLVVQEDLSWIFDEGNIDAMIRTLEPVFTQIDVIIYLRRQDRQLVSHYQQSARFLLPGKYFFGSSPVPLPAYEPHHDNYLDYHARLVPYVERLGADHVTARVFDRDQLLDGDAVTDFLALIGVDRDQVADYPDVFRNQSLGKTATKLGHLYSDLADRQINTRRLSKFVPDDPKLSPTRNEAEAVVTRYEASNERLAEMLGVPHPLFRGGFEEYGDTPNTAWTAPEVVGAIDGLRRLTRRTGRRHAFDIAPKDAMPSEVRALRRRAARGVLPPEDETERLLKLALLRLNSVALGRIDWPLVTSEIE